MPATSRWFQAATANPCCSTTRSAPARSRYPEAAACCSPDWAYWVLRRADAHYCKWRGEGSHAAENPGKGHVGDAGTEAELQWHDVSEESSAVKKQLQLYC